jgi:hypothetical protein
MEMFDSAELRACIENLYSVFSVYPTPRYTDPCLHCHTLGDDEKLRSRPLREMTTEDFDGYADDALLTWGDEAVYKHYLPRIFELFLAGSDQELWYISPETLFSRLRYGRWRTWPETEQTAIVAFLHSFWRAVLNDSTRHPDGYMTVESWICTIAQAEDDLEPYLSEWLDIETLPACLALSSLLLTSAVALQENSGKEAFWDERDPQYEQLKQWIRSAEVSRKLESAEARWGQKDWQEFGAARSMLE